MSDRTSTFSDNGLRYEVRVFEENGQIFAEIMVLEGFMDVNAVYVGDDDFSGPSASLRGPLNMNGARLDGEPVQWDDAIRISDPGLGRLGTSKPSFLNAGESLRVELTGVSSLDDVDVIGIRATSTSTPEGSIKGVTRVDEPDDDDDDDGDDPTFDKLFFVVGTGSNEFGTFEFGVSIFGEDNGSTSPNDAFLPEGSRGTLQDYLDTFASLSETREGWPQPDEVQTIKAYQIGPNGDLILVEEFSPEILTGDPTGMMREGEIEEDGMPDTPEPEAEDAEAMA